MKAAVKLISFLLISCLSHAAILPGAFMENKGHMLDQDFHSNSKILYLYKGRQINVQLRKSGYSYELFDLRDVPFIQPGKKYFDDPEAPLKSKLLVSRIDIDFFGMNRDVKISASEEIAQTLNFVIGGVEVYNVKSFKKILYQNVYDQVDIEFFITGDILHPMKYNIILHPGADPSKIKFLISGANEMKIEKGNLQLSNALGTLTERIPHSYYQDSEGTNVPVIFNLQNNLVSFSVNFNRRQTLVIDPSSSLIWGTYFGGSSQEFCTATECDNAGNIYLTGHTYSSANIATAGAFQATLSGISDLYLAKFNSSGTLLWSTYFGGNSYETSYGLRVAATDGIYLSGNSGSTVNVASPGSHQSVYGGGIDDAILVKFDANGQRLWSTYYGGNQHDIAYCLTLDASGNVLIGGHTESQNIGNCIATAGAYATNFSFNYDAFAAKFSPNGNRIWGTYFGDSGFEEGWAIASDVSDNVYLGGFSNSTSGLTTPFSHQEFSGGGNDGFIAKFDSNGSNLIWCSYYGGSGDDIVTAIELNNGDVFFTGNTASSGSISTPGSYQPAPSSADEVFLAKFNSSGLRQWATYYGGNNADYVNDLLIDKDQHVILCGQTLSSNNISTAGSWQSNLAAANSYDMYFARFKSNGTMMLASYFGNSGSDYGRGIAVDDNRNFYLCGESTSTTGLATPGSYMQNAGGGGDGVLAKFCLAPSPIPSPAASTVCIDATFTLSVPGAYNTYSWSNGATSASLVLSGPFTPGNYYLTVKLSDASGCNGVSDSAIVTVDNCYIGFNELHIQNEDLKVWPNPVKETLYIKNDGFENLEIFNAAGSLVFTRGPGDAKEIDLSAFSPGIYLLKAQRGEKILLKKFVKL